MEKDVKYYMLTILKDDKGYANIYKTLQGLKSSYHEFSGNYPVRAFELTPNEKDYTVVLANVKGKLIACLGPKTEELDENFIKCKKREMKKEELIIQTSKES